jgi:MFS superfamily sulfate permease-like transporter
MLRDFKASVSVFLVALPLCLGIAIASGAPPLSGLIAGIVGGIVVGWLSNSPVSVSGPAAGLTIVVLDCIAKSGGFSQFLTVLIIAGVIQLLIAVCRGGVLGGFFPGSVINGLLTSIGLLLILKQLPHAVGYDIDFEGDVSFIQPGGNTFSVIISAFERVEIHAILTFLVSIGVILLCNHFAKKEVKAAKALPSILVGVIVGTIFNTILTKLFPESGLKADHLVQLPDMSNILQFMTFPDFSVALNLNSWVLGTMLAIIASLETLINIDAADKLDPQKRITSRNRELVAQGIGNITSGLVGGLPITSVIVRTSVNVTAGARSKRSSIIHGFFLIASIFLAALMNLIPLSALAAVLIVSGYKLAHPNVFKRMFKRGFDQFVPFIVTVIAIIFSNLLIGVMVGMIVGLIFVIKTNYHSSILVVSDGPYYLVKFQKDVSFLNKSHLREIFANIPSDSHVILDGSKTVHIDQDILDTIEEFIQQCKFKKITFEIKRSENSNKLMEFKNDPSQQKTAS